MILPCIKLTDINTGRASLIPGHRIEEIQAIIVNDEEKGAAVRIAGEQHVRKVKEPAEQIAGAIAHSIEWMQTRAVAANVQVAEQFAKKQQNGIAIARLNGQG